MDVICIQKNKKSDQFLFCQIVAKQPFITGYKKITSLKNMEWRYNLLTKSKEVLINNLYQEDTMNLAN